MRKLGYGLASISLLATTFACDGPVEPGGLDVPFLTTDQGVYDAEVLGWRSSDDRFWHVSFSVNVTYANRGATSFYISYCGGPKPPRLERFVEQQWQVVYQPPHRLCGGLQRVGPGEKFSYEFRVNGYDPRIDVRPTWDADGVEGYYRVVWWPVWKESDVTSEMVPFEQRVSNVFRVTGELP